MSGSRLAINEVKRIKPGGLLILALPCNSFCRPLRTQKNLDSLRHHAHIKSYQRSMWLLRSQGTHQRSEVFPLGNKGYTSVGLGNLLCFRVVLLAMYAACKGIRYIIEQPNGSALDVHPAFRKFCEWSEAGLVKVICFVAFPGCKSSPGVVHQPVAWSLLLFQGNSKTPAALVKRWRASKENRGCFWKVATRKFHEILSRWASYKTEENAWWYGSMVREARGTQSKPESHLHLIWMCKWRLRQVFLLHWHIFHECRC